MIIVVNGIYKTQSTLIYLIFLNLFNQRNKLSGLENFLDTNQDFNLNIYEHYEDIRKQIKDPYVAKIHSFKVNFIKKLPKKCSITTDRDNVEIINSHYHHYSNEKEKIGFFLYFLKVGFLKLIEVEIYRFYAKKYSSFTFKYTREKNVLCLEILKFLGNTELEKKFSLKDIEKAYDNSFVRNGSPSFMADKRPWFNNRKSNKSITRQALIRAIEIIIKLVIFIPFLRVPLRWLFTMLPGRNRGNI